MTDEAVDVLTQARTVEGERRLPTLKNYFALCLLLLSSASLHAANATTPALIAAIESDDPAAFEPLVATDFDWDSGIASLIANYRCPVVDRWSESIVERTDTTETLKLHLEGHAIAAGRNTPVALPPFWIVERKKHDDQWTIAGFERLETSVARRMALGERDQWAASFAADSDVDRRWLLRSVAAFATDAVALRTKRGLPILPDDFGYARDFATFAIDEAQRDGDDVAESFARSGLSSVLRWYGKREEALPVAERALALAERSGDPDALASAYFSLGLGWWVNGDLARAQENLGAAARLTPVIDQVRMGLQGNAMQIAVALGDRDFRTAILRGDELLSRSHDVGWLEGEAYVTYSRADIHYALRDFELAHELYEKASMISDRAHAFFGPLAQMDMARCDLAMGNVARAQREIDRYRASGYSLGTRALTVIVSALIATHRLHDAEDVLDQAVIKARQEDDTQGASDVFTALAELRLAQGRPTDALKQAEEALRYGLHGTAPLTDWSPWRAEMTRGRALRALGRNAAARASFATAIDLVERLRSTVVSDVAASRYFEDKADLYAAMVDADLASGNVRHALATAERSRARTLADLVFQTSLDRNASLEAAERAREEAAEKRLEALNRRVLESSNGGTASLHRERDDARAELDRIGDELMAAHPELKGRRTLLRPMLTLPARLGSVAVVEYVVAADATTIFVITRDDGKTNIDVVRVNVNRTRLAQLAHELVRRIAQRDIRYRETAAQLEKLLLAPVATRIATKGTLCIIPDGALWIIPFQILRSDVPLFYSPSLTLLAQPTHRAAAQAQTLVAFANPTAGSAAIAQMRALFDGSSFGALPDTETEVRRIASVYGPSRSRVYVAGDARESTFKRDARSARIVHVATHGVIDDHAPLYSALLLAPDGPSGDDGLLEAREILDLHLEADLVVLSACDTARGKIGAGEGVVGLSWAFLAAGSRTIVVSQAPAESRATATLMVEFHRQLRAGATAAEALQRAQLALRREPRFSQPFYWAPFVVIGDGVITTARSK
jgi:CHAT domain-containing protein